MDITNPLVYGVPCFLGFIALELSYSKAFDNKKLYKRKDLISSLSLGVGSAIIDNVPLVAASMGMYDAALDSKLWHFIAYAAGTGGSMLIIGSAAGVAAMGMEKIDFIWYVKKITWLAAVGFLAGGVVFLLMYSIMVG